MQSFVQEFDPVRHVLESVPSEEIELTYFEEKVSLSLLISDYMYVFLNVDFSSGCKSMTWKFYFPIAWKITSMGLVDI